MLSLLRERLGQPERLKEEFRVSFGSPARYALGAEPRFKKSISAIRLLMKRHVPLLVAKRATERLLVGDQAIVDIPMLEDAAAFEAELRELGVFAVKEAAAAE
jgi:hypothetical protein